MKKEKREELENEKVTGVGKDVNHINEESMDKTPDAVTDTGGSEELDKPEAENKQGDQELQGEQKKQEDQGVQGELNKQADQELQGELNEQKDKELQGELNEQEDQEPQGALNKQEDLGQQGEQNKQADQEPQGDQNKQKEQEPQGELNMREELDPQGEQNKQKDEEPQGDQNKQKDQEQQDEQNTQEPQADKNQEAEHIDQEPGQQQEHEVQEAGQIEAEVTDAAPISEPEQSAQLESPVQPVSNLQTEDDTGTVPPKKKGRFWKKILIGFGCFVLLCIFGVYIGGAVYFQDKFFFNTKVNGMDVSKQTVEMVDNTIANNIHKYTITLSERGKKKEKITADQIGYHYVSNGEVQGFKDQQNPYTWPMALWENYRYKFQSSTTFDKKKLTKTLKALDCMNEKNVVEPKDAFLKFGETTYEIEPEVEGNTVDYDKLAALVTNLIEHGEKKASLEKNDCYVQPAVRSDNEPLNLLMNNLNQYCRTSITYAFGEKREVLDGKTIKDWVTYDEAGTVTFDEEQVRNYVNVLAEQYDTYDRPREFKTNDGSMVTVKGGSYGWMIDQEQEIVDLTKLIQLGAVQERTPAFAQTAVSFENSDLGQDYIEIDLSRQHLWMYIGGQVAVSSDFVSGSMVKAGCATPGGTYTLYYKKSPDVLRSDKPGDSYATPVTYWMPFNGGIGLHDANWRGSFGGSIYQYNGSHGCINLPTEAARQIYEQIYKGFPIICYYR
ncbi:L,D-transpeptidase family protein [uncultured Robinsoniella sp.]|uniref:L,D-transpeptidase family protein n=1 Tax=uncultured Robinsoniella sp. TaxID=904190 RepID=UPI00374E8604